MSDDKPNLTHAPEGASKRSAKDVMKKASTKNLFRHFTNKTCILEEAREYLYDVTGPEGDWFESDHWNPTNKYAFEHAYFPKEIMFKCPLLTFIYARLYSKIQRCTLRLINVLLKLNTSIDSKNPGLDLTKPLIYKC